MKYLIIAFAVYILYRIIRSYSRFTGYQEILKLAYLSQELKETSPIMLQYRKGVLMMLKQNFIVAKLHFEVAKEVISTSSETDFDIEAIKDIDLNISYCENPHPWLKEPKNKENSWITSLLIDRMGNLRRPWYDTINEDLEEANQIYLIPIKYK